MSWFNPPHVEKSRESGVDVLRLTGDWTRDLPLDKRRLARESLESIPYGLVVFDLGDVSFLDSWGEGLVCDVVQGLQELGARVAWVYDATRSAEYDGLRHTLARRKLELADFSKRADAVASFEVKP